MSEAQMTMRMCHKPVEGLRMNQWLSCQRLHGHPGECQIHPDYFTGVRDAPGGER
jgi:hypothetical protein